MVTMLIHSSLNLWGQLKTEKFKSQFLGFLYIAFLQNLQSMCKNVGPYKQKNMCIHMNCSKDINN